MSIEFDLRTELALAKAALVTITSLRIDRHGYAPRGFGHRYFGHVLGSRVYHVEIILQDLPDSDTVRYPYTVFIRARDRKQLRDALKNIAPAGTVTR